MSKREDALYLKTLAQAHKKDIHHWASIPLVIMETDSKIANKAMDVASNVLQRIINQEKPDEMHELLDVLDEIPIKEFMIINKTVPVNNPIKTGVMEYNYYHVSKISHDAILIRYPTLFDGISVLEVQPNPTDISPGINFRSEYEGSIIDFSEGNEHKKIRYFMSAMFLTVLAFFDEVNKAGLYAVETRDTNKHRKHNAKKPWQRKDQSTIVFLNQMPQAKTSGHQGGTHQSPRYHRRRATERKLTHPRYKNHPKYGQTIPVKASWVGSKEATVNGITYKVLE